MNLRDLKHLVALADHKPFGRAAAARFALAANLADLLPGQGALLVAHRPPALAPYRLPPPPAPPYQPPKISNACPPRFHIEPFNALTQLQVSSR